MAKASKVGGRGTTPVDAHIGQKYVPAEICWD